MIKWLCKQNSRYWNKTKVVWDFIWYLPRLIVDNLPLGSYGVYPWGKMWICGVRAWEKWVKRDKFSVKIIIQTTHAVHWCLKKIHKNLWRFIMPFVNPTDILPLYPSTSLHHKLYLRCSKNKLSKCDQVKPLNCGG